MYYGNTILIPVPESSDKGTIVLAKTGYVYLQTDYKWDPVKRQPRYTRTTIGRCPPEQTKLMYYSPEYEKIFGPVDTEVRRPGIESRWENKLLSFLWDICVDQSCV